MEGYIHSPLSDLKMNYEYMLYKQNAVVLKILKTCIANHLTF